MAKGRFKVKQYVEVDDPEFRKEKLNEQQIKRSQRQVLILGCEAWIL